MSKFKKMMWVIGGVVAFLLIGFIVVDGTFLPQKYANIWDESDVNKSTQEILIKEGMKAASSHNMQPWKIKILGDSEIELYMDFSKKLEVIDKEFNQMLISQGTFIDLYAQKAKELGYTAVVELHEPDFAHELPLVATIKIEKISEVAIVDAISASSMSALNTISRVNLEQTLEKINNEQALSIELISGEDIVALKELLMEGTKIESKNQDAMEELLSVFRFTQWDKNKYAYGLSLTDVPSLLSPFIQPIVKYTTNWNSFGEQGIKAFATRLEKETAYLLIKSPTISYADYIETGKVYNELVRSLQGYSLRPAVQLLETFDDMKPLNEKFQNTYGGKETVTLIITVKPIDEEPSSLKSRKTLRQEVADILVLQSYNPKN